MARVLAYTSPTPGHVYPPVGMLLELEQRGHDVHVRTQQEDLARLERLGLGTSAVDPRTEAIDFDDWKERGQVAVMRRTVELYAQFAELQIPDMQRAIDEVRPDVLLVDIQAEGALWVAEASGLPWALYCPYPPPLRSRDAPPHGQGLKPARGPLGRLRDRALFAFGDRTLKPHLAKRNAMRARIGLPPLRRYDEQWLNAGRFIAFTAEPYEYARRDWPESVRLVGPGTWDPPAASAPEWLDAETRPIVLVTASTAYQNDGRLIATALEALADEPVAVVATTAAHDPAAFRAPPNARVHAFLPHGQIMRRAACVVSHGGQGTTQKALAAGVPVCVVPFCRDQFDVARRVENADAGATLHHRRLAPERLRAAVRQAMRKKPGAERVAAGFEAAGGARAAADAIEELLPAHARGRGRGTQQLVR